MRKAVLIILLAIFALVGAVHAVETTQKVTFAWDDNNTKEDLYYWTLFMRTASEEYDYETPVARIDFIQGQTVFTSEQSFTITGAGGGVETRYFVIRANNDKTSSGDSNEVTFDFAIPLEPPFQLNIDAIVTTE